MLYALTWSPSLLPHSADKWKFCPYRGSGPVKASEGIIERPICPTQILILPLNRPLAACFMGLFSTRHFECCSVHRPSFPRTAFPLSPCPCLSPSRLRGLVGLPETEHHSVRMRLPKAPPRQEGAGHWLYDNNYCLLDVFWGSFLEVNKELACFSQRILV